MNAPTAVFLEVVEPYNPDPRGLFPVDAAARLGQVSRHTALLCYKYGLVDAHEAPGGGYLFDLQAIRRLQRVSRLENECGINFAGIRFIVRLLDELERQQTAARGRGRARVD